MTLLMEGAGTNHHRCVKKICIKLGCRLLKNFHLQNVQCRAQAKCCAKALDTCFCNGNVLALNKIATEASMNQDEKTFLAEKFTIGQTFESLGDHENVIKSCANEGKMKNAIETCTGLSKWDEAAAIVEGNKNAAVLNQTIESLLYSKIKDCLLRGNEFQALELHRVSKSRSSEA